MRAFILRRVALITSASGDVVLLGSASGASTLRLKQFLTRNTFPFVSLDVTSDAAAIELRHVFRSRIVTCQSCSARRVGPQES